MKPTFNAKQLQKEYQKHAQDFGVKGNWNKNAGERFEEAVEDSINNPATKHREGFYNKEPVNFSFNPATGQVAMTTKSGEFISGRKLSYTQLQHLIRTGHRGGH